MKKYKLLKFLAILAIIVPTFYFGLLSDNRPSKKVVKKFNNMSQHELCLLFFEMSTLERLNLISSLFEESSQINSSKRMAFFINISKNGDYTVNLMLLGRVVNKLNIEDATKLFKVVEVELEKRIENLEVPYEDCEFVSESITKVRDKIESNRSNSGSDKLIKQN